MQKPQMERLIASTEPHLGTASRVVSKNGKDEFVLVEAKTFAALVRSDRLLGRPLRAERPHRLGLEKIKAMVRHSLSKSSPLVVENLVETSPFKSEGEQEIDNFSRTFKESKGTIDPEIDLDF